MSRQKSSLITLGFVLSVSLITSIISAMLVSSHDSRTQFRLLNAICSETTAQAPETREIISAVLKDHTGNTGICPDRTDYTFLPSLGYQEADFSKPSCLRTSLLAVIGFVTGTSLFILAFLYRNRMEAARIRALADYLAQVHTGKAPLLSAPGEDDFAKLEDEIYKTVTALYHTKDTAVQAKNDFAKNLSNIAHQIKTPLTAASLSLQMLKRRSESPEHHMAQIEKQLLRLTHLEESLLVLSRMDAGTLLLQREETDVFTLLVLAADNLQELLVDSAVSIDIPEFGEMMAAIDLDWTMEAVMNLMKNCMEHSGAGTTIHCSYAQNPLYTEILIWDEGDGFAKEDIPHLFERFYRGQNAGESGAGIGLALAKEIIERQNGTIRAMNKPNGGALFEIRFYH